MVAAGECLPSLPEGHGVEDLTSWPVEDALKLCYRLVLSGGVLLHGSNGADPFAQLEPRPANDAAKELGNRNAVYASLDVRVALMQAVIDRGYLRSRFASFVLGYRMRDGEAVLRVTRNIYELFLRQDPMMCSDGHVYVLDPAGFEPADGNGCEYFCADPVVPRRVLKVAARLGSFLFRIDVAGRPDTVIPYSAGEQLRLDAHRPGEAAPIDLA